MESLHPTMQRRWNTAVEMFREAHRDKAIKNLDDNLNYLNKMTSQLEFLKAINLDEKVVRVAYTQAGQPTATVIRDNQAIADKKLYQTAFRSEEEAYYILAIINSNKLEDAAETFMPRGLYGARDLEKHGWKLPIPRYEPNDKLHALLSELGTKAEHECRSLIAESGIMSNAPGEAQSRPARTLLRSQWQPKSKTALAIENAVAQLLSDPAQADLAARQLAAQRIKAK